ncbi:MAG: outer membrane beta-barrel protein [Flavobacterium nitrogenifigens]|uniref:outer membrane beta-barrel protein n=1 Tax=Flavobacterium nitrogenifigens TaxID=1617283 RepID=UPI0028084A29|nr:outer membrane beta-barrel protein [Flavobacterium nitrogenifigens]MDQ8013206.1 outer membrane beta-barrel protein [Flavobacterium nitrogenifigens]
MKKKYLIALTALFLAASANAQKGNNQIQVSAQAAFPVDDLSKACSTGYGAAAKGLYGIGLRDQQVTLEAGYNFFPVKNLPDGVSAHYSAIPIYTGYRYSFSNFHIESQAGISINRIYAQANSGKSESDTNTQFGWAIGVGYAYQNIELGVRYQSSDMKSEDEGISFVAVRLGYNFTL